MQILNVKVLNYRNIDGVDICFNPECSYIIGENNLGKSNLLALLNTVCNGKAFEDKDFYDAEKQIIVEMTIKLLSNEQGFFGDNFSPDNSSLLRIDYRQDVKEAYPTVTCIDTNESISLRVIRKINYLRYETTSVPSKELRLDTQTGAGLLMNGIIERFITDSAEKPAFLNDEQVGHLLTFVNQHLEKIKSFRDYSIKATIASNPIDMLTSLFYLSDGERKMASTGSGVQFMSMASINILCQIMELYKSKSTLFEELLYTNDNGEKLLPLMLSIDEPEVHLHPYLQRSLISYYKRILKNKDSEFKELLKQCFEIDGIDGQLIIVTHSTDALIGNYRNLIRFYKNSDKTSVINGADHRLSIRPEYEKHLIMRFPEIKEAFYAKCAVLIEGETEYGCIHAFADKMGIPLDDYGICVLNARGESSIEHIRDLLHAFAIPSVAIYDSDVESGKSPTQNDFFTKEPCFEIEIVKHLSQNNRKDLIKQIAQDVDSKAASITLDADFVRKRFKKMGVDLNGYTPKKLSEVNEDDEEEFTRMYATWFMAKKGILLGRIIGEAIPADLIPDCYAKAIRKAQEIASNE